jgi:hypothetical protein
MRTTLAVVLLAAALGCGHGGSTPRAAAAAQPADTIYTGGDIVTVNDAQPSAEAVAVKDGRILAVGTKADIEKAHKGAATKLVDLAGRTLVPGLIDGHAHVAQFGTQAIGANLLAAPDGHVETIDDLIAEMRKAVETQDLSLTGWIFGMGYDDAILGRHPNRDDLDKVSTTVPVLVVHISGHFSAVNSVGLKKIGYTAATPDPAGGVIRRRPGSKEPNGVLEETAHFAHAVGAVAPKTPAASDLFMKKALELAKSFGYTTANEGMTFPPQHAGFVDAAKRGLLDIDVIGYVPYANRDILDSYGVSTTYEERYRLGGMKVVLDGSPQGRTAWRTVPYKHVPDGQEPDYRAYPAIPDTKLLEGLFDEAYQKKWPTHVHANGDAAIDQFLAALQPVQAKYGAGDRRNVLIHGQFIRPDQLDALKELQVIPSLFPMHTFYWGDWYDKIIGPELAAQISPMRSAIGRGMMPTSHTDAPVALPNLMQVMWATVNRVTRSGKVQGPDERISPIEALKAITLWSAYEHFEEKTKGSIEVGKLADLVILSANPLTIDPMKINQIVVMETIKEGKTVYTRP